MDCVAIIPARYGSQRFPGKVLAQLAGRPLIHHVLERVARVRAIDRVIVATDDERVAAVVRQVGVQVRLTPATLPSGTDRVARVAAELQPDVVLNVQGDEPLIDPEALSRVLADFRASDHEFATLRAPLRSPRQLWDPNVVKVVVDASGRALYFSRAPIPFPRQAWLGNEEDSDTGNLRFDPRRLGSSRTWRHVGVYLYRTPALRRWARMPVSDLERAEGLEQLRILEAGEVMVTYEVAEALPGVDTPEDLERVREHVARLAASQG